MSTLIESIDTQFSSVKPRVFDTYVLPPFIVAFAVKAKEMPKLSRRILFISGIFMFYRNYTEYKNLLKGINYVKPH